MTGGPLALAARLARSRGGAAAVETAFVLPLLLTMLLGTIEFGRLAWTRSALDFAVQEAARCRSVARPECDTAAEAQAFAASKVAALAIPASAFTVTEDPACGFRVRAEVLHKFVAWRLFGTAPTLTAQVCRP